MHTPGFTPPQGTAIAPYRHVEIERVVECDSCARHRKEKALQREKLERRAAIMKPVRQYTFKWGGWTALAMTLGGYGFHITPDRITTGWQFLTGVGGGAGFFAAGFMFFIGVLSVYHDAKEDL